MNLRQAYEMVIGNELRELYFEEKEIEKLVGTLSNNEQFHSDLTEAIRNHIEYFGDNYEL